MIDHTPRLLSEADADLAGLPRPTEAGQALPRPVSLPPPFRKQGQQIQADGETTATCDLWCREQVEALVARREASVDERAHFCIAPACGERCHHCSHAISPEDVLKFAKRYAWLRERGSKPLIVKMKKATVICGPNLERDYPEALDAAIDAGINATKGARHD